MADAYNCPKCDVPLQAHDDSADFSVGRYFGMELVFWTVFLVVLSALWTYGYIGELLAFGAALAVVLLVLRGIVKRAREAALANPTRRFCPRCLSMYPAHPLSPSVSAERRSAP